MNLNKPTPEEHDDYTSFMVYLRKNNVWEVMGNVFLALNEIRPDDPIEFFRANVKTDNSDSRAVERMRRKVAEVRKKIAILERDKFTLTTNLNLLDERIRTDLKTNSSLQSTVEYTEDNDEMADETFSDSKHVE